MSGKPLRLLTKAILPLVLIAVARSCKEDPGSGGEDDAIAAPRGKQVRTTDNAIADTASNHVCLLLSLE